MAEFSYPFDAGTGAIVTEDDWSDMAKNWQDDGVVSDSLSFSDLEVESLVEPNTINVNPGMAVIQGFMYRNTDVLPLTFSTNGSADPRWDRVVLRLDRSSNTIVAAVKEGTPSPVPVAPDVDTVYPIHEISLGWYQVAAGSSVTTSGIEDRPYTSRRIIVAEDTIGQPQGSIVYNPDADTFNMIKSGSVVEIGTGGGGGSSQIIRKPSDQLVVGTTAIKDTDLVFTPVDGSNYIVEGAIYFWCDTPGATMTFRLSPVTSTPPSVKAHYQYVVATDTNPRILTATTLTSGVTVGANASSTFYTINYHFSGRLAFFEEEFDLFELTYQPAAAGPQWTISANSWMRTTVTDN